jgi:hypothetical protein
VGHERIDLLDDIGRDVGIGRRANRPGAVGAEIDIAQERGGGATFLGGQSCENLGAPKLLDLLELGWGILAVEGAQRLEQAIGPTGGGIAVITEYLPLAADESGELRRGGFLLWRCRLRASKLLSF